MRSTLAGLIGLLLGLISMHAIAGQPNQSSYSLRLTVTSELLYRNVPMDPPVDFAEFIRQAALPGVLDPNSITIADAMTGEVIPHALTEDFAYGDRGRLEWVIRDPKHKKYEIRFKTAKQRPPLRPAKFTPLIGVGDQPITWLRNLGRRTSQSIGRRMLTPTRRGSLRLTTPRMSGQKQLSGGRL